MCETELVWTARLWSSCQDTAAPNKMSRSTSIIISSAWCISSCMYQSVFAQWCDSGGVMSMSVAGERFPTLSKVYMLSSKNWGVFKSGLSHCIPEQHDAEDSEAQKTIDYLHVTGLLLSANDACWQCFTQGIPRHEPQVPVDFPCEFTDDMNERYIVLQKLLYNWWIIPTVSYTHQHFQESMDEWSHSELHVLLTP